MDLTQAEDIKKTEELYKKDGAIAHLEPDTLECKVKWVLGSITMHRVIGGDEILAELFLIPRRLAGYSH